MTRFSLKYGIDAPQWVALQLAFGALLLVLLSTVEIPWLWLQVYLIAVTAAALVIGSWMLLYSTWIKLWHRRVILGEAGVRSGQRLLDVGTGRGLLAISAAALGAQVTALDKWSARDLSGNGQQALELNCRLEGTPQIRVMDGEAQRLPFADKSFDAVVSHFVVHNIGSADDRELAILEMWRVLRTGGVLVLSDFGKTKEYEQLLASLTSDLKIRRFWYTFPFSKLLVATKK
ncbi:class I SAM-dependent methyltransferase [Paenibacillus cremeus]|uniref:Class I SAM-dependent methyltransferase n=1 Tax=Paenibacillus cremeus TaxID=2163881 RepID=A0A559K3Y6_9BACL|nr:class I SAM-dependent methyltransferase [Paenibacillus cremeus]TVY06853.1 class I SAM-dependent methyltransferase [Paenibacillus cremeus]